MNWGIGVIVCSELPLKNAFSREAQEQSAANFDATKNQDFVMLIQMIGVILFQRSINWLMAINSYSAGFAYLIHLSSQR